jgi:DNA mismatch repair protein MSH4
MISDRVLCHFCFKPKKVTIEAMSVDRAKKSQVLVSSVILLKTALDALPLLSKVPLPPHSLSLSHTHAHPN